MDLSGQLSDNPSDQLSGNESDPASRRNLMKKIPSRSDVMKKAPSLRNMMLKKPSRRGLMVDDDDGDDKVKGSNEDKDPTAELVKKNKRERATKASAPSDDASKQPSEGGNEEDEKKRHASGRRSRLTRHQSSAAVMQGVAESAAPGESSTHSRRKKVERTKSADSELQTLREGEGSTGRQHKVQITRRGGLRKAKTSRRGLLLSEAAASQKSMRNIMVGDEPIKKQKSSKRLQLSENDTPSRSSSRQSSVQSVSSSDDDQQSNVSQRKGSSTRKPARRGQLRRAKSSRRHLSQQQANPEVVSDEGETPSRRRSRSKDSVDTVQSDEEPLPETSVEDIIKQRRKARGAPEKSSSSTPSSKEHKRHHEKKHGHKEDRESSGKKHSKSSSKQRLHRKKSKKFVGLSEDDEGADPDAPHIPQSASKESTTSHKSHSRSSSYGSDGLEEAIGQENVDYLQFNPENTHLPVVRRRGSVSHDSGNADAPPPAQQSAPPKRGITRSKSDDYLQFNPEDPSSVLKKTGEDSIHTKSPVKKVTRPGLSRASSMNRVARPTDESHRCPSILLATLPSLCVLSLK